MKLSELRTKRPVAWPSSGDVSYMSEKGGYEMDADLATGFVRVVKGDVVRIVSLHGNMNFMEPAAVTSKGK